VFALDSIGQALRLRLSVTDIDQAGRIVADAISRLEQQFPGQSFQGLDWSIREASLFNALKMEKILIRFLLFMIVVIGAFNIVSTLVMVVNDKQADIAILRTMGAGKHTIMSIFMVQGLIVGVLGTFLGAALGILVTVNFASVSALIENLLAPGNIYLISRLPAELQTSDVILVCLVAPLISFLATLYPAWRASRIHPAEVLRYE
ncbi:MAG: FtsX-like permease family protein, partial [Pseudohongiellaceae bacterium]